MASDSKPKKKEITLMEEDIEKGLSEKKVQNLVLKKILDEVDPGRKDQLESPETKNKSSKY
jgi:hypothetical protein